MKRTIGILLFLAIGLSVYSQSLLWKVSGNGLIKPSYVFGTHHLAPLSVIDSIQGLKKAFEETTQVIGEVEMKNIQSPEIVQAMQKAIMIQNDTTLITLLSKEDFEHANILTKSLMQLDMNQAPKLKPSFLCTTLTVLTYMKEFPGFNPQEQLDTYFQAQGTEKGKSVSGLETIDFQFNLLYGSSSLKRQAEQFMCLVNNSDQIVSLAKELNQAYFNYDLMKMLEISERKEGKGCDALPGEMEALIDKRNSDWADKLPALIKEKSSFIAVGALHLPGKNGLLALLKNLGYTVEPVK